MLEEPSANMLSTQIQHLEDQRNNYKRRCQELETIVQARNDTITKLKISFQVEKLKSRLFAHLLENNTSIKVSDIWQEDEKGCHIQNYENGSVPVFVHDYLEGKEDVDEYLISAKKQTGNRKVYRGVKKADLVEEKPEEQEEKTRRVDEGFSELLQANNLDCSYKSTIETLDKLLADVVKTRTYNKILPTIWQTRTKLLGTIGLEEYTKTVTTHIRKLETIFTQKQYDAKKTITYITKSLSPLEQRLTFYAKYFDRQLLPDEIQTLQVALKVNADYPRRYIPMVRSDIYKKFHNYGMAIIPLKENVKRVLVNPYGFNNLVYLDQAKSTTDDPFSFYMLESIDSDGKRRWKMEIRLDDFSKALAQNILNYCVPLFRKIYLDIFNDNIYREDYREKAIIANEDCEQLLYNIFALGKPVTFCNSIRDIIVKSCTHSPTQIDKFNLTADDRAHKRQFKQETDTPELLTQIVQRLFDQITDEEVTKFLEAYTED